jgi:hypothetical protein
LWVPGQIISNYPVIFERMRWDMLRSALNLMEDILSTFNCNKKLYVSGHI